jgi:hypothetical protein
MVRAVNRASSALWSRANAGIRNAAVLPVPVRERATTLFPARASGIIRFCTSVGSM